MSNTPNAVTYDFSGQTALVTGGGGNLGQAVAGAFYQSGARVVVADRRADLQSLFPAWQTDERVWMAGGVDFLDPEAVQNLVNQAVQRFQSLDILVNTVGGYRAGQPVHETPLETWDFMMDLNLRTTLHAIHAALPSMLAQGAGKIVNTAASSALKGDANSAAYSASKSAVARLTESLSAETLAQRDQCERHPAQCHRHPSKPGCHAQRRYQPVGHARVHRPGDSVPVQPRQRPHSRCIIASVWQTLTHYLSLTE